MGESHAPIKVRRGICLPVDRCATLTSEPVPVGEEVTELMLHSGVLDSPSPHMVNSSNLTGATHESGKRDAEPGSGQCALPTVPARSACTMLINKLGGSALASTSLLSSKTYESVLNGVDGQTAVCHHLRSRNGPQPRSLSVGHLGCLIRALLHTTSVAKTRSLPLPTRRQEPRAVMTVLSGSTEIRHDQPVDETMLQVQADQVSSHVSRQFSRKRSARSASPDDIRMSRSGSLHGSFCPSTVRWLDNQSSGAINRKAVFTLDSSFDGDSALLATESENSRDCREGNSTLVEGKHLLLPGRSDFEDQLVREVAHFELAEFVIGELEALNAMTRAAAFSPELDSTGAAVNVSSATRAAVCARPGRNRVKSGSSGWRSAHSSLGFLAFVDPQNPRTIPGRNCTVQHPTKDEGPNPFADLFGLVQQGLFINADGPRPEPLPCSHFATGVSSTPKLFSPMSPSTTAQDDVDLDEPDLGQSRVVTTLASDLLTSCLERFAQQPPNSSPRLFLKDLHQLLVVSCDADWAFREPVSNSSAPHDNSNGTVGQCPELIPNRSLIPSNSAVLLPLYNDSGGQKLDLISIDPNQPWSSLMHRRRSHSVSVVEHTVEACSTSSELDRLSSPGMRRSNASVHRTAPFERPRHRSQLNQSCVSIDSKSGSRWHSCFSPVRSVRRDSASVQGPRSSINAICTPLPYDLLTHPPLPKSQRKLILLRQNNRCAGCGLFVETRYLKRMRFCEFFGHYFCCVCHTNTLMTLPGNVLYAWDFRMLPVCNIARDRLNQLHRQPLFRLSDFNPRVAHGQSGLRNCCTLRKQGNLILPFVQFCHAAQDLLTALRALPPHWLSSPELWSLADLCAVRDGQLDRELRRALQPVVDHLSVCTRCRAQGFVCEICHSGQILFPFGQANTVSCSVCMACFHRTCLRNPKPDTCPRCQRRAQRRRQQQQQQRLNAEVKESSRQLLC